MPYGDSFTTRCKCGCTCRVTPAPHTKTICPRCRYMLLNGEVETVCAVEVQEDPTIPPPETARADEPSEPVEAFRTISGASPVRCVFCNAALSIPSVLYEEVLVACSGCRAAITCTPLSEVGIDLKATKAKQANAVAPCWPVVGLPTAVR
jgi:hypothetical protein